MTISWIISCKQATELLSKKMDTQLSWREKFQLQLHLLICKFCDQFEKQILLIRKVLRKNVTLEANVAAEGMSQEAKERIKKRIF